MKLRLKYSILAASIGMIVCGSPLAFGQTQRMTEVKNVDNNAPDKVKIDGKETDVYQMEALDSPAEYPGGLNALMTFIAQNLVYPASAAENNIQGRVVAKFVVTKTGDVANIEIIKSVDPALDAEAIRVISLLKGFKPGTSNGKNVDVWYALPLTFRLQND